MQPPPNIAALGEVLWDLLPNGPALGGAPANFAATLAGLMRENPGGADCVSLVSSVGEDARGLGALEQLEARQVSTRWIVRDATHPTGTVEIALKDGIAQYTICSGAAWDFIPCDPGLLALAPQLDAVYFGTLAQRSPVSRATLRALIDATRRDCLRVLDINLRAPWWTPEILRWSCAAATVVKMSEEEVPALLDALELDGAPQDAVNAAHALLRRFPVEMVAITRGAQGSLLVLRAAVIDEPGIPARVADTIGAGDAFTAGLAYALLAGGTPRQAVMLANRCGAWGASRVGGMPPMSAQDRNQLLAGIF
jgi:fructokinase